MSQTKAAIAAVETAEAGSDFDRLLAQVTRIEQRMSMPVVQPMELRTFAELERWAQVAARSKMVPYAYQGKPDDIILSVQMGAELGLRPMQSLQNIATINGKPSVYGDAMLALCMGHPLYVSTEEWFEGEGDTRKAVCRTIRKGTPPVVREFSVSDAKTAKLWGKKGRDGQDTPWITNPDRMLQFRARGFALRDAFPDKLRGLISVEEAADYDTPTPASMAPEPVNASPQTRETLNAEVPLAPKKQTINEWLDALETDFAKAQTAEAVDAIIARPDVQKAEAAFRNGALDRLNKMTKAAIDRTAPADDGFPGQMET